MSDVGFTVDFSHTRKEASGAGSCLCHQHGFARSGLQRLLEPEVFPAHLLLKSAALSSCCKLHAHFCSLQPASISQPVLPPPLPPPLLMRTS